MAKRNPLTRTTLTGDEISKLESRVLKYLATHDSIANREIRALADIGYDQVGTFFKTMISRGVLRRIGAGSQTRYALPE